MADAEIKEALLLDANSRVFVINTEGATDPSKYEKIVGLSPAAVAAKNLEGVHA